jgi:cytidylate kinase
VDREKATELARTEDRGRARYLKKYFDADIDDAELYHMTFNTSAMDQGRIVDILASLVRGGTGM